MAKRFIETDIWMDIWFRGLSPKMKILWLYLYYNCDYAGFYYIDLELMKFSLKQETTIDEIKDSFSEKILFIDDTKIFIKDYIFEQNGGLKLKTRPHKYIYKKICEYNLEKYVPVSDTYYLKSSVKTKVKNQVHKRDKNICAYCKKKFKRDDLHVDHIKPRVKGGTHDLSNLTTSCIRCNLKKGDKELV